ncbi:cyclopropane fatty acid synthase [Pandoraea captiosa]|uniref:Cyclopropane fatty acid synthase n=1 Tax=Pandoraea captiosa TaxID=2508302 RepID=A0A5E4ZLY4_9BURK|nr:DUF1365 domain-containing protein [Pandoraea captiosa]VVE62174.1 cyclopropane fatty acid synthase [Pandoraea captiosa]
MTSAHRPDTIWLLRGRVRHERLQPVRHAFTYPMFQVACDLERSATLRSAWFAWDRWRLLSLRSSDYGPRDGRALVPWMRAQLAQAGIPADGEIWLQTVPRMAGYAFNPVSFWYCHDRDGRLRALYADVRNTFGQHHGYLLSATDHGDIDESAEGSESGESGDIGGVRDLHDVDDARRRLVCRKVFHVSPFCDVEGQYEFRIRRKGDAWTVAIDYRVGDELRLRTAVVMHATPFTGRRVLRAVLAQPFAAVNIVLRIHWQALRLWCKGVPFFGKTPPSLSPASPAHATSSDPEIRS